MMWPFSRTPKPSPKDPVAWRELLEKLTALGFFRGMRSEVHQECMEEILKRSYLFDKCTGRVFGCDAEGIAEAGAVNWINKMRPHLSRLGISRLESADLQIEPDYVISINGESYTILEELELDSDYQWAIAQARLMNVLDKCFLDAGSNERTYVLYAGNNDSFLVFLTPDMYRVIRAFADRTKHELPISATDLLARVQSRSDA